MKISKFLSILEEKAPLYLSKACIDRGDHDNSGVIIKASDEVNKVLFTLDLSIKAVNSALKNNCDCIVTHHPAIYYPISSLSIDNQTSALLACAKNGISVISMHLNLDMAKDGIDDSLATVLGGKNLTVVEDIYNGLGYGKEFEVNTTFLSFIENAKSVLRVKNCYVYGNLNDKIKKVVSFCGGGSGSALKYLGDADVIVTTDMPHHIIKEVLERGQKLLLITHYASEFYGFTKFYDYAKAFIPAVIFDDEIFL